MQIPRLKAFLLFIRRILEMLLGYVKDLKGAVRELRRVEIFLAVSSEGNSTQFYYIFASFHEVAMGSVYDHLEFILK